MRSATAVACALLGQIGDQNDELIAPQTRYAAAVRRIAAGLGCSHVRSSDALMQPACDGLEQRITDRMSQIVVDSFEAIEIQV